MAVAGIAAAVLLGLLLFRWRSSQFRWDLFLQTFAQLNPNWIAAAVVLILVSYVGRALRWRVMIRPFRPQAKLWNLVSATLVGFTALVLLGRPGELVRPYLIAVRENLPFSSQMAAWLLERVLDLLVVLLIFGFSLTQLPGRGLPMNSRMNLLFRTGGTLVAGLGFTCILFLFLYSRYASWVQQRLVDALGFLPESRLIRVQETLSAFELGMESTRKGHAVVKLLAYTAAEWAVIVGSLYCVFKGFPGTARFTLVDVVTFTSFIAFGSIVQIPGIGGGLQVVAIVVLTEIFGLNLEASTGLAMLIWLLTFVVAVPLGVPLAFHEGLNWHNLRHIRERTA